jgi:LmbE family N-acetylglucosaminyl deacetylase
MQRSYTLINLSSHILVVAAHPDDEVLMCGGTLSRFKDVPKSLLVFTDGRDLEQSSMIEQSAEALGFGYILRAHFADQHLDAIPQIELNIKVEEMIDKCKPSIIISLSDKDLNADHKCVNAAVKVASRPKLGSCVKHVLFGEVPSTFWSFGENFSPNLFFALSEKDIETKIDIFETCYPKEVHTSGDLRSTASIKALASLRGNTIGEKYAEAFYLHLSIS